jgi:glycosyltransferase involved in cell wall biosynthesis
MKIIYLHQYFNTPKMSGGTRSYEMARHLVDKGHEVNMVTSCREEDDRKDWFITDESGIKVHWLPVPYSNNMGYAERLRAFFRFAWRAARKAASLQADVVFATSTPLTIALPGAYAAHRQNIPMVFEVRDLWPEIPIAIGVLKNPILQFFAKKLERFAYNRSQAIVTLSSGMRDGVIREGFPQERITVIPNISDLDHFQPNQKCGLAFRERNKISKEVILVVYTGTFGRINGVSYLIRMAAELKNDKQIYFLTVGDGQEFDSVKELAIELGCLGHNLKMLPSVPKTEIYGVLAAADVATSLVIPLPELEANSANKFFDGLSAGCCMAINHGGWQADLLLSSGAGLQLDSLPKIGALQLQSFIEHKDNLTKAGQKARLLAEQKFSRDKLTSSLENILINVHQSSNYT